MRSGGEARRPAWEALPVACWRAQASAGQRADRGGVVEDAVEVLGQAQPVAQPADGDALELRADRRDAPDEGVGVEAAADELARRCRCPSAVEEK